MWHGLPSAELCAFRHVFVLFQCILKTFLRVQAFLTDLSYDCDINVSCGPPYVSFCADIVSLGSLYMLVGFIGCVLGTTCCKFSERVCKVSENNS